MRSRSGEIQTSRMWLPGWEADDTAIDETYIGLDHGCTHLNRALRSDCVRIDEQTVKAGAQNVARDGFRSMRRADAQDDRAFSAQFFQCMRIAESELCCAFACTVGSTF